MEKYAACFDDLLVSLAQRRGLREYLIALMAPRDRNKTLTCLAGVEPVTGSKDTAVQRLQFFLPESTWDAAKINDRRLELIRADPATAPHDRGVLVIDDSGDRKDGTATAHVGRQWLGRLGKTDNGIVTVTTVWTDGRGGSLLSTLTTPRSQRRQCTVPGSIDEAGHCTSDGGEFRAGCAPCSRRPRPR
ncbi:transposase [Streptomyces sp. NPDC020719]|uniref:transposase n=1 Tax=Streptomyces sp. NPDC020719 TaxID=3154896 RepID=UPI0033E67585